jgi:thiol-disulfide isomerase/thioredoxin
MRFSVFLIFTFAFLLSTSCRPAAAPVSVSNKPVSINNIPQTNVPMPPLANVESLGWQVFDGQTTEAKQMQTMGDLKGKVVILDFWATYCPPCLEEIPDLVKLQEENKDVQVIGLHVGGEEDKPNVPAFVEKLKMNYPLAVPQEDLSAVLLQNESSIPQTFVFNREGKLVEKFVGYDANVKNKMEMTVMEALNNSK